MPKLAGYKNCTGCTACVSSCNNNCITMKTNKEGFLFPDIDSTLCVDCGKCTKACPVINNKLQDSKGYEKAYAIYSLDEELRMKSSSGGIFSELAKIILKQDGYIYGAAYTENYHVEHMCIDKESDLERLQGAKYSQSNLQNIFKDIYSKLISGKKVMFSGTPCQVSGLKRYLNKEYANLYTIDFICHGIPSPMVWDKYVQYRAEIDNQGKLPSSINLRSKHTGWTNYKYSNLYCYEQGNKYSAYSGEDLFMQLFVGDYINRKSCESCCFKGYSRESDLTIGDFWGIWNIDPDMDDNKGTSAVIVHSDKGMNLLNDCRLKVKIKNVSLDQISMQNPSLLKSSKSKKEREKILGLIYDDGISSINGLFDNHKQNLFQLGKEFLYKIYCKIKNSFIIEKIRRLFNRRND